MCLPYAPCIQKRLYSNLRILLCHEAKAPCRHAMGHSFRSRLEQVEGGGMAVIRMKDLTEDNRLNVAAMARIEPSEIKARQRVEPDDIVTEQRG